MSRQAKRHSRKAGLAPGTLVHVGERRAEATRITVLDYDEQGCRESHPADLRKCTEFRRSDTVSWINVDGVHDVELIAQAGEVFGIHPLVLEDILNTNQRSKFEDYESYAFLVVRMLTLDTQKHIAAEQVSVVFGPNFVLSFQEAPGDVFDPVRERIRNGKGRIRKMGNDYLAHCLVDAVLDGYFAIIEDLGDRVEDIEERLVRDPDTRLLAEIYRSRRECAFLRKSARPLREMIGAFERVEGPLVREETAVYLRNLYDHTIQILDTMESLRDTVTGMLEMYLSSASNRMNEVMKVLTIIATIFIPLTFIAGVYGMNFEAMPELKWRWAYPMVWVVMATAAGAMVCYFRRKKWL